MTDALSHSSLAVWWRVQIAEVRELLAKHNARATFFVCSKYLAGVEAAAAALTADGHEFGNHLNEDLPFVYNKMPRPQIDSELRSCTSAIEALPGAPTVRWFRAPQAMLSRAMAAHSRRSRRSHSPPCELRFQRGNARGQVQKRHASTAREQVPRARDSIFLACQRRASNIRTERKAARSESSRVAQSRADPPAVETRSRPGGRRWACVA